MTDPTRDLYLDLLAEVLCNTIYRDPPHIHVRRRERLVARRQRSFDPVDRAGGTDWPSRAHTMIGQARLDNVRMAVETVITEGVPGDLIETGVWRGGACIFMRGILRAHDVHDRSVYVADSFMGLPPPDPARYPADAGLNLHKVPFLAISLDEVKENFSRYGLLDDQVVFVEGWFRDTLPHLPAQQLAVLRLDGDLYESTYDALEALHHRVSPGGFVIIDDYGVIPACRAAVTDFREGNGITDQIIPIDDSGVYWRRAAR
jgi:hypothetical protein